MDARTYQEVKKELDARREARRAKLERAELEAADELAEIERLEKINQSRKCSVASLRDEDSQQLTLCPRCTFRTLRATSTRTSRPNLGLLCRAWKDLLQQDEDPERQSLP